MTESAPAGDTEFTVRGRRFRCVADFRGGVVLQQWSPVFGCGWVRVAAFGSHAAARGYAALLSPGPSARRHNRHA